MIVNTHGISINTERLEFFAVGLVIVPLGQILWRRKHVILSDTYSYYNPVQKIEKLEVFMVVNAELPTFTLA